MYDYVIKLNNIEIEAAHGLYDSEKKKNQIFEVDARVRLTRENSCLDDIDNSIDYENIYKIIRRVFNNNTFNLLETLGEEIISQIFNSSNATNIEIVIRKPGIKFDRNSNCVEVSISRKNE